MRTAARGDEVLDRGKLGTELLVQACVEHFDHAIPWDRMACVARQQGVPLAANTLASSVGRLIDLMDPIVTHITAKVLGAALLVQRTPQKVRRGGWREDAAAW